MLDAIRSGVVNTWNMWDVHVHINLCEKTIHSLQKTIGIENGAFSSSSKGLFRLGRAGVLLPGN